MTLPEQVTAGWAADAGVASEALPPGTCHGCGACWYGEAICHCARCHLTFTSIGPFDFHQVGPVPTQCMTEARLRERGYEPNSRGHWRKPRPPESIPGRTS